jgi:magnesium chelatase family protein
MNIHSFLSHGTEVHSIEAQIHFRFQIPSFHILGLAGPEIQEARERIIAAFASSEIEFPRKKVIVNLAPSDLKKNGTGHDLAIAIGIVSHFYKNDPFQENQTAKIFAWGELGLDGKIQPCGKTASLIDLLVKIPESKILFLCPEDARELEELRTWRAEKNLENPAYLEIKIIQTLREVIDPPPERKILSLRKLRPKPPELLPLLPHQERVLGLSIVGRHHTLILGPKGVGKSQLLEWYRWLTPESDAKKTWQRLLYSAHSRTGGPVSEIFPLRSVHAQVKPAHLLGSWGSKGFRAGELSLAHGGILVADEFLEWHRDAKECLREPLQNKKTTITRVQGSTEIACDFQLIATGNLCPCGGLPAEFRTQKSSLHCRCRPGQVEDYLHRLSGPIAERIDLIHVINEEIDPKKALMSQAIQESSILEKKRFLESRRSFAIENFGAIPSELSVTWLETHFPADPDLEKIIKSRSNSLRSRHKAMRLARTIQAFELSKTLKPEHLMEALNYRMRGTH